MTNKTNELREVLSAILDSTEDKELIGSLTTANNLIDEIDKDNQDINSRYKDLLNDYKEVIKHTSFKPNNNEQIGTGLPKEQSLEDLIKIAIRKGDN